MFKKYYGDYVIIKDSGNRGDNVEKLKASQELDIIYIIGRGNEKGIHTLGEIKKIRGHR